MSSTLFVLEVAAGLINGIAIAHLWKKKITPVIVSFRENREAAKNQILLDARSREIDELTGKINEFVETLDTKAIASITEGTATYEGLAKLYAAVQSLVSCGGLLVSSLRFASREAGIPSDSLPPLFVEPSPEGSDRKKRKS